MGKWTRRNALKTLGAATAATALPSMPALAAQHSIRHFWWGNPNRDERTYKVIEGFNASQDDIEVAGETIGWGDYWTKMATQTAGGNMADLVQMDYRFIFEYVRRGALKSLTPHIGKGLDLSDFDEGPLSGGMVDGELYGLNIGSNSQVIPFNTRVFEEAGVDADVINWTRDDFANACEKITSSSGGNVKGSSDFSLEVTNVEAWSRQNGRFFYDNEGNVQTTVEDVTEFLEYWKDLRDAGVIENADKAIEKIDSAMSESGVVTGETSMSIYWSNQLVAVQSLVNDTIGAAMLPHKPGGKPAQFIKPSMFMSMTRDAKNEEAAIAYMNNWINEPAAYKVLGLERGIPAQPSVRNALAPSFSPAEKLSVDYFAAIQDLVGPLPLPAPKGAGEVRTTYARIATEVALGQTSPADAAARFIDESQTIVERAR